MRKFKVYIIKFFLVFIFFPTILMVLKSLANSYNERQREKRYRKIIKKGLFWDSEYLIERD